MKIRLDAMELDTENSEMPNFDKVNEELAKPQKRKQEAGSMEIKSQGTSRIPNMSFEDSIEHVLKLITKKPMTSRDIEVTFGGRSREHVSRLMKKLYDENGKMIDGNWQLCKKIVVTYIRISIIDR